MLAMLGAAGFPDSRRELLGMGAAQLIMGTHS